MSDQKHDHNTKFVSEEDGQFVCFVVDREGGGCGRMKGGKRREKQYTPCKKT